MNELHHALQNPRGTAPETIRRLARREGAAILAMAERGSIGAIQLLGLCGELAGLPEAKVTAYALLRSAEVPEEYTADEIESMRRDLRAAVEGAAVQQ